MTTRTRSKKSQAKQRSEHSAWVQEHVTARRGGLLEVLDESEREPEQICVCKDPPGENLFWVACDICAIWYHGECIGKRPEDLEEGSKLFVCGRCEVWLKQKEALLAEVKPHAQVNKAALALDLEESGHFLTAELLPGRVLAGAGDLLAGRPANKAGHELKREHEHEHERVRLVDCVLAGWAWEKRSQLL